MCNVKQNSKFGVYITVGRSDYYEVWAYTCECNYSNAHYIEKNALLIHDNVTIVVIEIIAEYEKMVHL